MHIAGLKHTQEPWLHCWPCLFSAPCSSNVVDTAHHLHDRQYHLNDTYAAVQVADLGEIQLTERGRENKPPLRVTLPIDPVQPASDGRTPLSSLGGRPSQAATPLDGPGPHSDTALFYNGLFRSSLRHGLSGLSLMLISQRQ